MRNVLKGGLRSLIPQRNVKDADEVLDRLDDELSGEDEAGEEEVEVQPKEKVAAKPLNQKVKVMAEVVGQHQQKPTADRVHKKAHKASAAPEKPLVTPLTMDMDIEEEDDELKKTAATKAKAKAKAKVAESEESAAPAPDKEEMWDKHEDRVYHIAVADISINPAQQRRSFDKASMTELTNSIEQHGILQPLVARRLGDGYELVAGERRLRAAKALGWKQVPCVVRRGVKSNASRLELALIENIQREDLNPVEEAMAYRQLNEEYGMTHEEIGHRVGRSRVSITNSIRVLQLPEEVQQGITAGAIAPGHAKAVLMIPDQEKQVRFYRHLVEEGLTVRKAETRARRIQRTMQLDDPMREKRKGRSAYEIKQSGKLEDYYGYDAKVKFLEHKNRFEILFRCYNQDDIEELLGRLMGTRELPKKVDGDVIDSED